MGAWRPCREFGSARIGESERYDVVGDGLRVLDDQVGLVLPDDGLCGRHCHNRVRPVAAASIWDTNDSGAKGGRQDVSRACRSFVRVQIRIGPCAPS